MTVQILLSFLALLPLNYLAQGFPTPSPWTGTGWQPVRKRATQQEVSGRRASEGSSAAAPLLPITPHLLHYHLNHPPTPVRGKIVFHETGPWC